MQAYSDPKRERDPYALPDIEVFQIRYVNSDICPRCLELAYSNDDDGSEDHAEHVGFYWQACFPSCLPDGDAVGPFATAEEALTDAREGVE